MSAVQFAGKKQLMDVFEKRGLDNWAIFQGKNLNMTGDGAEQLGEYLTVLADGPSNCVYTLKVYSDSEVEPEYKTPVAASWNFYSQAGRQERGVVVAGTGSMGALDIATQKFQSMMADKMGALVEKALSGEPEEKKATFGEIAMGYLEDPEALNAVLPTVIQAIGAIKQLFSAVPAAPLQMYQQPLAAVSGLQETQKLKARVAGTLTPEVEYQRLSAAYEKLKEVDANAVEHIEQLAVFAHKKPDMYFTAINTFLK